MKRRQIDVDRLLWGLFCVVAAIALIGAFMSAVTDSKQADRCHDAGGIVLRDHRCLVITNDAPAKVIDP